MFLDAKNSDVSISKSSGQKGKPRIRIALPLGERSPPRQLSEVADSPDNQLRKSPRSKKHTFNTPIALGLDQDQIAFDSLPSGQGSSDLINRGNDFLDGPSPSPDPRRSLRRRRVETQLVNGHREGDPSDSYNSRQQEERDKEDIDEYVEKLNRRLNKEFIKSRKNATIIANFAKSHTFMTEK